METIINLTTRIIRMFVFFMLCNSLLKNEINAFYMTIILTIFYEKLDIIDKKAKEQ